VLFWHVILLDNDNIRRRNIWKSLRCLVQIMHHFDTQNNLVLIFDAVLVSRVVWKVSQEIINRRRLHCFTIPHKSYKKNRAETVCNCFFIIATTDMTQTPINCIQIRWLIYTTSSRLVMMWLFHFSLTMTDTFLPLRQCYISHFDVVENISKLLRMLLRTLSANWLQIY